MPLVSGSFSTSNAATTTPVPRMLIVVDNPRLSTIVAPRTNPVMLPRMAMLVIHPAAVARMRVGNSSERCAVKVGVHIDAPALASRIAGASTHPLDCV